MKKYKKVIEYETVCWDKEPIKYNELVIMGILIYDTDYWSNNFFNSFNSSYKK